MATNRIQMLRSITPGARPSGKLYGEPYFNLGDNQFGVFDSSNVARDLIGVPMFSASKAYSAGNVVNNSGQIYVANTAVSAGSFNPAQWTPVTPSSASPQPNLFNGKLVEAHASNAATFSLQTLAGATPSAANPVGICLSTGAVLWITGALSLTIPAGAAFSTVANLPFRLWFLIVNNGGTPLLCVQNCVSQGVGIASSFVNGFDGRGIETALAISATTSAANLYATSAFSNQPYGIVGFADYEAGQPTAGQYTLSPTRIVQYGPGIPLPGTIIQSNNYQFGPNGTQYNSATFAFTTVQCAFIPVSVLDVVQLLFSSDVDSLNTPSGGSSLILKAVRQPTAGGSIVDMSQQFWIAFSFSGHPGLGMTSILISDYPRTTASQTYSLQIAMNPSVTAGNGGYCPLNAATVLATELMG